MSNQKIYPILPTAPSGATYQEKYHLNTVRESFKEIEELKKKYARKIEKTQKVLDRLITANASTNGLSVAFGVGGLVTSLSVLGIPVSIGLGSVAVASAISGAITTIFVKKYQQKLSRNEKLYDVVTSAWAVFETNISRSLQNGTLIDEKEFNLIQSTYFESMRKIGDLHKKMKAETQASFEKTLLEEIHNLKKKFDQSD